MSKTQKNLLPQGFHDHLPPEAALEMQLNSAIVKNLNLFGYDLVRPAMMEFEESLDKDFSSDLFKVTDTVSGKMMVIRNDITPQIARVVKDRFGLQAAKKTIRLSYTGQVIRKLGRGKFTERQLTQTGFELVSEDSAKRDAEVLYVAIETYQKAGVKNFTVDLCYPKLAKLLLKQKGFNASEIKDIVSKIESKDTNSLTGKDLSEITEIIKISDEAGDIKSAIKVLEKLEKKISSKEAVKIFSRIKEILQILSKSVPNLNISLNLLELMDYNYHSGLCYSFISNKTYDEIGRGGRYKIPLAKENFVDAAGFTFLVNSMLRCVEVNIKQQNKKLSYKEGFAKSKNLREKGITTIFE